VQWIIVQLSSLLEKEDISVYTGISVRSIERTLKYFKDHRTVQLTEQEKRRYQRTHLRDLDVEVSLITKSKFGY
jgi:transcription initiation factor IIE alpha subunit